MIHKYGAVSRHVARLMADNARKNLNVDIAVSVTGIAGPSGGTPDKPVGTVWIGLAQRDRETTTQHFLFQDMNREQVRQATIHAALNMIDALLVS